MATRKLNPEELGRLNILLADVRQSIAHLAADDPTLLFAFRRKLAKELIFDERSKPSKRKMLKRRKLLAQNGKCANCGEDLPSGGFGAVLDRIEAMAGYTDDNTHLICSSCDQKIQMRRGFGG